MATRQEVTWVGEPPAACQLCNDPLTTEFVDGRTILGPWACMCLDCWQGVGMPPLGTDRGQHYRKDTNGVFTKVGG